MQAHSFPPIAHPSARVLILGSMPGQASLLAGQYYAHPRNAFWPIMGQLLGFAPSSAYQLRVDALKAARIAVWDVLKTCERPGSLDANIVPSSIVANDFAQFFSEHPQITDLFFNGSAAETCFRRHVTSPCSLSLRLHRLPSSSPAHAARTLAEKCTAWQSIVDALKAETGI